MNDHQDTELELQKACSRWTWDEKAVAAIAVGSILLMVLGGL